MTRPIWLRIAASTLVAAAAVLTLAGCPLFRGHKPYGDACSSDTDCDAVRCAPVGKFCTKGCTSDSECGAPANACVNGACDKKAAPAAP